MPSGPAAASSSAGTAGRRNPRQPASATSRAADQKRSHSASSAQMRGARRGTRRRMPGQKLLQEMSSRRLS
jgi:hypothetical protein